MPELTINIADAEKVGVKIITLTGEMDEASIENVKAQIDPLLDNTETTTILFDLKGLVFINSKGIGYLVSIQTHMSKSGRAIMITQANDSVMDVISLVGLTSIIKYFATLEEAIGSIG